MHRAHLLVLLSLLAACEPAPSLGAACVTDSRCADPLVCRLGRCRNECVENRDCAAPLRCLLDETGLGSCSLDTDDRCETGAGQSCPSGLLCVAGRCANACGGDEDCPADGLCRDAETTGVRFCFAPDREDGGAPFDAGRDVGPLQRDTGVMDAGRDARVEEDAFVDDAAIDDAGNDAARSDAGPCTGLACGRVVDLCVGGRFACAVRSADHGVVCWGSNQAGELGDGVSATEAATHESCSGGDCSATATRVLTTDGDLLVADDVECRSSTACAVNAAGEVYCWGSSLGWRAGYDRGAGGHAYRARRVEDALVDGQVISLEGTESATCGITSTGVVCWGVNLAGHIGPTGVDVAGAPRMLDGSTSFFAASFDTCHVVGTALSCRGADSSGQLGPYGPRVDSPTRVALDAFPANVTQVVGGNAMCALSGTDVYCWGSGASGALGGTVESTGFAVTPTLAAPGHAYDRLWGDGAQICARTLSGPVECWGGHTYTGTRGVPTVVPALNGSEQVVVTPENVCARDAAGVVRCSGENVRGVLGLPPAAGSDPDYHVVCLADRCLL